MRRKRILVAKDHEDSRRLLAYRLRKIGDFDIIEATYGQEALDLIVQNPPDLMFLDLELQIPDGRETVRRIRALQGAVKNLPIIGFTCSLINKEKVLAAGCDDYISDLIIDINVLKEKLERFLS